MNPFRSRTMAVMSGAVVLAVLSAGGGAVASGLIGSADIRNNSIRSADIRNGGVRSVDLRDGGVAWKDLRTGVKKRINAPGPAGAVGSTGEQGDAGAKGDTGAQGPQGPRGTAGSNGTAGTNGFSGYEVVSGAGVVFSGEGNRYTRKSMTAACPDDKVAIGGGFKSGIDDNSMYLHTSYPSSTTSWTVVVDGYLGSVQPYTICVSPGL